MWRNPLERTSVRGAYPVPEPLPAAPLSVNAAFRRRVFRDFTARVFGCRIFLCAHERRGGRDETGTQARRRDGKDKRAEEGPR